ncbi:uncharacterized protein LOC134193542 [Corticium candelabrum]|uniref:uncharacterized protein LOC134193542 n=1 Tax=Corticium candelabrum TaxID=121492 RepID=UPI002E25A1E8|nr:uncharacterized protein LOC134193542 [Corticium candelabrum]
METVGFILLDNVTGFNESALQEVTEWLFNMPQERKLRLARKKWNKDSRNNYRGYFPVDVTAVSHKEGYEFGPEMASRDPYIQTAYPFCEPNVWPEQEDGEDEKVFIKFSETVKGHYVSLFNAAIEFTRLLALGLGLSENYFDQLYIPKTLSTFRLLHYPLRQDAIPATAVCDDGTVLCCDAHVDSGMFTLLTTFNNPGLQIRMKNGTWMPVESHTGTLIANMGKMMAEMSGDRIKAVEH